MSRVREKLVKTGLWDSEDPRDPETDEVAAEKLLDDLKNRLRPGISIIVLSDPGTPPVFHPLIRKASGTHALEMTGILAGSAGKFTSRVKAICAVALALPEFLKRHPEIAAPVV